MLMALPALTCFSLFPGTVQRKTFIAPPFHFSLSFFFFPPIPSYLLPDKISGPFGVIFGLCLIPGRYKDAFGKLVDKTVLCL